MTDGPKRTQSDTTLVVPRSELPKPKTVDLEAITLVPCPACDDEGMVTVEKRAELAAAIGPEVDEPTEEA